MTKYAGDPHSPWRDRQFGGMAPEDRAAGILRGSLIPGEPDERVLARMEEAIHARTWRQGRLRLTLRVALAAMVLFAGVATAKAYELARRAGWFQPAQPTRLPSDTPARSHASRRLAKAPYVSRDAAVLSQEPALPTDKILGADPAKSAQDSVLMPSESTRKAQPLASESSRRPTHTARRTASFDTWQPVTNAPSRDPLAAEPARSPAAVEEMKAFEPRLAPSLPLAPAPVPAEIAKLPPQSDEIHALDLAIGLLRRDHNASAALPALDAYLGRYPRGILSHEARLARVDALLMLERSQEALAALEALPLDHRRRSTELHVVRGELRAREDCARAEEDFTAALTHSPDAGLLERILYDRGVCRAQLGNRTGATEDLHHYLERFPNGTHVEPVRRWLQTISKNR